MLFGLISGILYCKYMYAVKWSKNIISLQIGEHLTKTEVIKVCLSIKYFFND